MATSHTFHFEGGEYLTKMGLYGLFLINTIK